MPQLLYLNASPRGDQSASHQAAQSFLGSLSANVNVARIDLFDRDLPEVTSAVTAAKIKQFMGAPLEPEESRQWSRVTATVAEFMAADHYLFAIPMWNFSVPYKLKHYIDVINHPGLTFTRDAQGHRGLATGTATLIYARGGDYSPVGEQPDPLDFQSTYVKAWLTSIGISEVTEIPVQNTIGGPEAIRAALADVAEQLRLAARSLD